jgi:hypothetical protein
MPKICLRFLTILGFISISILLIFYIIQVNQLAKTRFEVLSYKKEIAGLFRKNQNLEIYYSQTNSLASLDVLLEDSNYVKVDKVHYIQILDEVVAIK